MSDDSEVRAAALDLVLGMQAEAEAEEWEGADSFVALTTNAETGTIHINGTFIDAPTALAWAEKHEHALNLGMPPTEDPYLVQVYPCWRPG